MMHKISSKKERIRDEVMYIYEAKSVYAYRITFCEGERKDTNMLESKSLRITLLINVS